MDLRWGVIVVGVGGVWRNGHRDRVTRGSESVQMLMDSRNSGIPVVPLVGNAVETTSVVERYVEYNFDRHLFRGTVN